MKNKKMSTLVLVPTFQQFQIFSEPWKLTVSFRQIHFIHSKKCWFRHKIFFVQFKFLEEKKKEKKMEIKEFILNMLWWVPILMSGHT